MAGGPTGGVRQFRPDHDERTPPWGGPPQGSQRMRDALYTFLAGGALLAPALVLAGPPFLTDDPAPVDYQHNEFYVFSILDHSGDETSTSGPAFEYNRGVIPNVQFHI